MDTPYTFHAVRKTPEKAVIDEINNQLALVGRQHAPDLRAQLLMQELARRDQDRQARIMIICTVMISALTILIAVLTAILVCHEVAHSL